MKVSAQDSISFLFAGVGNNVTLTRLLSRLLHTGVHVAICNSRGEEHAAGHHHLRGGHLGSERQRNGERHMERKETQNREMCKNYLRSKISPHQGEARGVTFHSSLKIHVY